MNVTFVECGARNILTGDLEVPTKLAWPIPSYYTGYDSEDWSNN
jgi:hypothetical protein